MEKIEELEQQEKELVERLNNVRREIADERLRITERDHGVRVGSIVKDRKGVEHVVTKVIPSSSFWGGQPWLEGNPKKKDGTFGNARRNLYSDWTVISK